MPNIGTANRDKTLDAANSAPATCTSAHTHTARGVVDETQSIV